MATDPSREREKEQTRNGKREKPSMTASFTKKEGKKRERIGSHPQENLYHEERKKRTPTNRGRKKKKKKKGNPTPLTDSHKKKKVGKQNRKQKGEKRRTISFRREKGERGTFLSSKTETGLQKKKKKRQVGE